MMLCWKSKARDSHTVRGWVTKSDSSDLFLFDFWWRCRTSQKRIIIFYSDHNSFSSVFSSLLEAASNQTSHARCKSALVEIWWLTSPPFCHIARQKREKCAVFKSLAESKEISWFNNHGGNIWSLFYSWYGTELAKYTFRPVLQQMSTQVVQSFGASVFLESKLLLNILYCPYASLFSTLKPNFVSPSLSQVHLFWSAIIFSWKTHIVLVLQLSCANFPWAKASLSFCQTRSHLNLKMSKIIQLISSLYCLFNYVMYNYWCKTCTYKYIINNLYTSMNA